MQIFDGRFQAESGWNCNTGYRNRKGNNKEGMEERYDVKTLKKKAVKKAC
jgi:hypothetical protein